MCTVFISDLMVIVCVVRIHMHILGVTLNQATDFVKNFENPVLQGVRLNRDTTCKVVMQRGHMIFRQVNYMFGNMYPNVVSS